VETCVSLFLVSWFRFVDRLKCKSIVKTIIRMTHRKKIEWWETKTGNCDVTAEGMNQSKQPQCNAFRVLSRVRETQHCCSLPAEHVTMRQVYWLRAINLFLDPHQHRNVEKRQVWVQGSQDPTNDGAALR
jgi:hypothetical protein